MLKLLPILLPLIYGYIIYRFSVRNTLKELDAKSTELADRVAPGDAIAFEEVYVVVVVTGCNRSAHGAAPPPHPPSSSAATLLIFLSSGDLTPATCCIAQ